VSLADVHLETARTYARQLAYERVVLDQMTDLGAPLPRELSAVQGEALRLTIVECTQAIVAAIREKPATCTLARSRPCARA
jgi:hypothetical protein